MKKLPVDTDVQGLQEKGPYVWDTELPECAKSQGLTLCGYPEETATLDEVAAGTTVRVCKLAKNNPELYCKLHAMGVVCGCTITVLGRAPFGDPIAISTLGYQLSLRASEAQSIQVATSCLSK